MPVTVPELTLAMLASPLLQAPPVAASLRLVVAPTQTVFVPVIGAGAGPTVTVIVAEQPADVIYVMVNVHAATPVTIPVVKPTVATDGLLLLHVPPPTSLSAVVEPTHTFGVPVIAGTPFDVSEPRVCVVPAA